MNYCTLFVDVKIPVIGTPFSNQRRHFQIWRRWGPSLDPIGSAWRIEIINSLVNWTHWRTRVRVMRERQWCAGIRNANYLFRFVVGIN